METWKELPDDVLVEILLNLSMKSLIRLSCVSKKLRALIKNSDFTCLYSKCNKHDILLVQREVENEDGKVGTVISLYSLTEGDSLAVSQQVSIDLRLIPCFQDNMSKRFFITGPCNGLICVSDFRGVGRAIRDYVVLCNPILQEFKVLPPTTFSTRRGLVIATMGLSLGFDPCTNDYKLVRIVCIYPIYIFDGEDEDGYESGEDDEGIEAEVYDLRTNLWRRIEAQVPFFDQYRSYEFFYKGCCYISGQKTTICFNTSSETFSVINYPKSITTNNVQFLTVLNDYLALFSYSCYMKEPNLIDIWVMKEQESWVKEFTIGPILFRRPLSWHNNFILFEGENRQLVCCQLDTNKIKNFEIYCHRAYCMQAIIYRESFVSIH